MIKVGSKIKPIGVFVVTSVDDKLVKLDAYESGNVETFEKYKSEGTTELVDDMTEKEFDGYSVGDFFRFDGEYKVVSSNEIYTQAEVEGKILEFPNHKLKDGEE